MLNAGVSADWARCAQQQRLQESASLGKRAGSTICRLRCRTPCMHADGTGGDAEFFITAVRRPVFANVRH